MGAKRQRKCNKGEEKARYFAKIFCKDYRKNQGSVAAHRHRPQRTAVAPRLPTLAATLPENDEKNIAQNRPFVPKQAPEKGLKTKNWG